MCLGTHCKERGGDRVRLHLYVVVLECAYKSSCILPHFVLGPPSKYLLVGSIPQERNPDSAKSVILCSLFNTAPSEPPKMLCGDQRKCPTVVRNNLRDVTLLWQVQ